MNIFTILHSGHSHPSIFFFNQANSYALYIKKWRTAIKTKDVGSLSLNSVFFRIFNLAKKYILSDNYVGLLNKKFSLKNLYSLTKITFHLRGQGPRLSMFTLKEFTTIHKYKTPTHAYKGNQWVILFTKMPQKCQGKKLWNSTCNAQLDRMMHMNLPDWKRYAWVAVSGRYYRENIQPPPPPCTKPRIVFV